MTRIILVRHGHVEGIHPERFRGRTDLALTDLGLAQARAAAAWIAARARPAALLTSPMQRCVQTAREIGLACGIDWTVLAQLDDLDYGAWRGCTPETVRERWPELFERWLEAPHLVRFPQGETLQELAARLADVIRLALERHPADTVVIVGHDSGIRAVLLQFLEQPLSGYRRLSPAPGSVSEIEVSEDEARVLVFGESPAAR